MFNHYIFSDTLHRVQSFLQFLAHQIDFAKGAVSNNTQQLKVFECGIDQSILAPKGFRICVGFVISVELRVEIVIQTDWVSVVAGLTQVLGDVCWSALSVVSVLNNAIQIFYQFFSVWHFGPLCWVGTDFVVRRLVLLEVRVFFVNSGQHQRHSANTSTHVLLTRAEVGKLFRLCYTENWQIVFLLRKIYKLETLEQVFTRFQSK